jgi:heme exporter protein B
MSAFVAVVVRDVRLAFRAGGGALQSVSFFALTVVLFALAVGPDIALMSKIAAPVLWAGALLATLISLEQIYRPDKEDGSLDVLAECGESLALVALAKALAHWMSTGVLLVAATPVLALLLNLRAEAIVPLIVSLVIGTPGLSLIGAVAGALAAALPRAGVLIAVIVGPLYAPILIFGSGAAVAGAAGDPQYGANLMLLGASSLFAAIISPLASAAALRFNLD